MKVTPLVLLFTATVFFSCAQQSNNEYTKIERMIPMRDGMKLFTAIYIPKGSSENYPILMMRTPYSVAPYGENNFKEKLGPNPLFARESSMFSGDQGRRRAHVLIGEP